MTAVKEMIMLFESRLKPTLETNDKLETEHQHSPPLPTTATELLHLPNELILLIFFHCEDFKSGAALSATSQRLHDLWLNDKNKIMFHLLQKSMPLFDVALGLAIEEIKMAEPVRDLSMDNVFSREDLGDIIPIMRRNYGIGRLIWDTRYAIHTGGFPKPRPTLTFTQVLYLFYIICDHIIVNRHTPYNQGDWTAPSYAKSAVMNWDLLKDLDGLMSSIQVSMRGREMSIYGQTDLPLYFKQKALDRVWLITDRHISD